MKLQLSAIFKLVLYKYFRQPVQNVRERGEQRENIDFRPLYCDMCQNDPYSPHNARAKSMCSDCEKYICDICIQRHSHHLIYSIDNNDTPARRDQFYREMVQSVKDEGGEIRENFMKDKSVVVDRLNVEYERDDTDCYIKGMCAVKGGKKWVIVDFNNMSIKVFNGYTNTMMRYIKLSSEPWGVTEIPRVNPLQTLIGITMPKYKLIIIMDIESEPARIVHSIDTLDHCFDVSYCKDKFIVLLSHSIQVIDTAGEIVCIINPEHLQLRELGWAQYRFAVNEDSETIYLFDEEAFCAVSVNGQVLNTCKLPVSIFYPSVCIDKQQNVYVWSYDSVYKLSADLNQCDRIMADVDLHNDGFVLCINDTFYFCDDNRVLIVRHE